MSTEEAIRVSLPRPRRSMSLIARALVTLPRIKELMTWSDIYQATECTRHVGHVQDATLWLERHGMLTMQRVPGLEGMRAKLTSQGREFQSTDHVGLRYSRLTILGLSEREQNGHSLVWCLCDCGKVVDVKVAHLRSGNTKTCGCGKRKHAWKHGNAPRGSPSSEYQTWSTLPSRAKRQGVPFEKAWHSFKRFQRDVGKRPENMVLSRIDLDGGWVKGNVEWVTRSDMKRRYERYRRGIETR